MMKLRGLLALAIYVLVVCCTSCEEKIVLSTMVFADEFRNGNLESDADKLKSLNLENVMLVKILKKMLDRPGYEWIKVGEIQNAECRMSISINKVKKHVEGDVFVLLIVAYEVGSDALFPMHIAMRHFERKELVDHVQRTKDDYPEDVYADANNASVCYVATMILNLVNDIGQISDLKNELNKKVDGDNE